MGNWRTLKRRKQRHRKQTRVGGRPLRLSVIDGILKDLYLKPVRELLEKSTILLQCLQGGSCEIQGSEIRVPADYSYYLTPPISYQWNPAGGGTPDLP